MPGRLTKDYSDAKMMLPALKFRKKERSRVYRRTADLEIQRELNLGSSA
jgi:hypothetical protein